MKHQIHQLYDLNKVQSLEIDANLHPLIDEQTLALAFKPLYSFSSHFSKFVDRFSNVSQRLGVLAIDGSRFHVTRIVAKKGFGNEFW